MSIMRKGEMCEDRLPGKYPSASYSQVKFESTLIVARVVVDFFARQASAASVAKSVTKF